MHTQILAGIALSSGSRNGSILVVDDQPSIAKAIGASLVLHGHTVRTASSGPEALDILARGGTNITLLITDLTMPGMSGRELFMLVRAAYPTLPVIAMTGFTNDPIARHLIASGELPCILKPFDADDLAILVDDMLPHEEARMPDQRSGRA